MHSYALIDLTPKSVTKGMWKNCGEKVSNAENQDHQAGAKESHCWFLATRNKKENYCNY